MDPITIGLVLSAVGAIGGAAMNYSASEEMKNAAQSASAEEQKALVEALDIIGKSHQEGKPQYASGYSPDQLKQYLIEGKISPQQYESAGKVNAENFQSVGTLTPYQYSLIQKYTPTIAKFTEEQTPHLITESGSQAELSAQKQALQEMQRVSAGGFDPLAQSQQDLSQMQAEQAAKSQRANILKQYASRGLGGSGQELAAQLQTAQTSEDANRQAALQAQQASQQRRLDALRSTFSMAGDLRGQATNVEKSNLDVINAFNQRAANRKQIYEENLANQANQAQAANIAAGQNIANMNVGAQNQAQAANLAAAQELANRNAQNRQNVQTQNLAAQQSLMNMNTEAQNQAQAANLANAQQIANQNVAQYNQNLLQNQQRNDSIEAERARLIRENAANIANLKTKGAASVGASNIAAAQAGAQQTGAIANALMQAPSTIYSGAKLAKDLNKPEDETK